MFLRLENKAEIANAQKQLEAICRENLPRKAIHNITFRPSKLFDCEVLTDGKYWVRNTLYKEGVSGSRYVNSFGLYYEDDEDLSITVEVNAYEQGLGRRVAGFYAKDLETQNVYLMHSGGIRGGTPGQGKYAFLAWRNEKLMEVIGSDGRIDVAIIVMPISGAQALEPALRYVDTVAKFKADLRRGVLDKKSFKKKVAKLRAFYEEGSGRRQGTRRTDIDYISRHGEVVTGLKLWLEKTQKRAPKCFAKNKFLDLAVVIKKRPVEIYEVKTSADRQSIYTAIGQLAVHSTESGCAQFVVLPEDKALPSDIDKTLKRMDIGVVRYRFLGKKLKFKRG